MGATRQVPHCIGVRVGTFVVLKTFQHSFCLDAEDHRTGETSGALLVRTTVQGEHGGHLEELT